MNQIKLKRRQLKHINRILINRRKREYRFAKIAAFMDIDLDAELLAITREHASLRFMQKHRDRFDDAMMRALTEKTVLPSGSDSSKVRVGKMGDHELSTETVAHIQDLWSEHVTPVTGFATYNELIASLAE